METRGRQEMTGRRDGMVVSIVLLALVLAGCRTQPVEPSWYENPNHLRALITRPTEPYRLVDVRTEAEYASGHIPTAMNIPYGMISEFPPTPDTSALIVLYCASGSRSAIARQNLEELGYRRIVDFGSLSRWKGKLVVSYLSSDCPCEKL